MTEIRITVRPRWQRLCIAPRVWRAHYRLFRRYHNRRVSARSATRLTWLMVRL